MAYVVHLTSHGHPDSFVGPFADKNAARRWVSDARRMLDDLETVAFVVLLTSAKSARSQLAAEHLLLWNDLW